MKTFEAVRTSETISIDGQLDETAWASAAVVEDLHQILPVEYAEPSQRTRFLVLYDSEAVYVGGEMFDTEPELLTAKVLRQGGDSWRDDVFELLIDPFNEELGYPVPDLPDIDLVLLSHEHADHANVGLSAGTPKVLCGATADVWHAVGVRQADVSARMIPGAYHDEVQGAARGRTAIISLELGDVRFVHLGDLGPVSYTHLTLPTILLV